MTGMSDDEYDSEERIIPALWCLGPDVGEPEDAQSVPYIDSDLERQVMEAILRYPTSGIDADGKTHGLAAVAAITTVEKWLLARGADIR